MTYVPYKKGTLLIPTGNTKHLFVVVTDKCKADSHLLINITSVHPGMKHDETTIIEAGEHPFIKHQSYVEYRRAEIFQAAWLTKMVAGKVYTAHSDASEELLQAIVDGIEDSDFIAQRIVNYYKING
jgi:hypothetical protein